MPKDVTVSLGMLTVTFCKYGIPMVPLTKLVALSGDMPSATVTPGTYPLTFVLKVYSVETGNFAALTTYTVGYYKITINAAAGIELNKNVGFNVMQNNPNPVANNTTIKFTSATDGKAKMSVYNIAGQKLVEKEFTAQHGDNSYDFDATALESGIYVYAIELNGQKQIRRMVVAK